MGYDSFGKQITSRGDQVYLGAASYTPFGEPAQYTLGTLNTSAWLTYNRDPQTRRLTEANLSAQTPTPQIDDTKYTYDASGNQTSTTDLQGPAGSPTETQCDTYDALDRLAATWTANDNCAGQTPTSANIGGPQPFWESWSFDPNGLRTSQTHHALPGSTGGDTTTTYAYPAAGSNQPDTLTSTTTGDSTTGYAYDADGNTTTMGNQNLTWDADNHLATAATPNGTTSYVYDADGNELLATDPNSITLFLPGEDLTYSKSTQVVTGTRYITVNGQTIVDQTAGANPLYIAGDPHGTQSVAWDPVAQTTTRRTFDPYDNQVGQTITTGAGTTGPGQWPGQRQFLNDPVDGNTGLTDIGARQYDSTTGRFISVDPQPDPTDPMSLNSYAYGDDNPNTRPDPTGMHVAQDPGGYVPTGIPPINTGLYNTLGHAGDGVGGAVHHSLFDTIANLLHPKSRPMHTWDMFGVAVPRIGLLDAGVFDAAESLRRSSFWGMVGIPTPISPDEAAKQFAISAAQSNSWERVFNRNPNPIKWVFDKALDFMLTHTVAVCLNVSASAYVAGGGSLCGGLSGGHWVLFGSDGVGAGTPGLSASGTLLFSNAFDVNELSGRFDDAGGAVGDGPVGTGQYSWGSDSYGRDIWEAQGGVGLGAGPSGYVGTSCTYILAGGGNYIPASYATC